MRYFFYFSFLSLLISCSSLSKQPSKSSTEVKLPQDIKSTLMFMFAEDNADTALWHSIVVYFDPTRDHAFSWTSVMTENKENAIQEVLQKFNAKKCKLISSINLDDSQHNSFEESIDFVLEHINQDHIIMYEASHYRYQVEKYEIKRKKNKSIPVSVD